MTKEIDEPSYYEVALTNRQVLMAFIVILAAVLGSFLCGVWVGQGGRGPLQAQEMQAAGGPAAKEGEDLESFRFFADDPEAEEEKAEEKAEEEKKAPVKKPDLSRLMDEPDKGTTLAEDVGSHPNREARRPAERKPNGARGENGKRHEPPPRETPRTQPAPAAPPPAPPPPAPPPPAPASPPPAETSAAADEGFIVQVFSSHDEEQARKIRSQVEAEGYTAFISPVDQSGETFYRVRIGPFEERARAERAARGLKKKLKLETWVTAAGN